MQDFQDVNLNRIEVDVCRLHTFISTKYIYNVNHQQIHFFFSHFKVSTNEIDHQQTSQERQDVAFKHNFDDHEVHILDREHRWVIWLSAVM